MATPSRIVMPEMDAVPMISKTRSIPPPSTIVVLRPRPDDRDGPGDVEIALGGVLLADSGNRQDVKTRRAR